MTELAPGPWVDIPLDRDLPVQRLMAVRDGVPVLLDPGFGWVSLYDGALVEPLVVPTENAHVVAVSPDGRRIAFGTKRWASLVIADTDAPLPEEGRLGFHPPIGFDPGRFLLVGGRQQYQWIREGLPVRIVATSASGGEPAVHQRKNMSSDTNSFRWIHVTPDLSHVLSVADYDVVLSRDVPRGAGPDGEWEPEGRALLFRAEPTRLRVGPGESVEGADGWEGLRRHHATVVLGPSDAARYVVALEDPVVRVVAGRGTPGSGEVLPLGDAFAVYDAEHRERRRGKGRLLAGWGEWLTGVKDGWLFREHIETGERVELAPAGRPIVHAIPLVGTPNVVLFSPWEKAYRGPTPNTRQIGPLRVV